MDTTAEYWPPGSTPLIVMVLGSTLNDLLPAIVLLGKWPRQRTGYLQAAHMSTDDGACRGVWGCQFRLLSLLINICKTLSVSRVPRHVP